MIKVRKETAESFYRDAEEFEGDFEFVESSLEAIQKENPVVFKYILEYCEPFKGKTFLDVIVGMVSVYMLVRNESEARKFEREMSESS